MPKIYWLNGYNIREGKYKDFQAFLKSKAFKKVWVDVEKETGIKYVETYGTVIPSPGGNEIGDFDCYDLYEMPNHSALDKMRKSDAVNRLVGMTYKFVEYRPSKSVLLRKINDVMAWVPEKK
jgi:hypothetical protein